MNKESRIKDWQRLYDSMNDPEMADKIKREEEVKKRRDDEILDTGL